MSEYNLKIRNKFINKLLYKINDLNENFELLQKVDKKIFKNMKGGNLDELLNIVNKMSIEEIPVLKAPDADLSEWKKTLNTQNESIKEANQSIKNAEEDINQILDFIKMIKTIIQQLISKIEKLKIPNPKEQPPPVPEVVSYERTENLTKLLEDYNKYILTLDKGREVIKQVDRQSNKYNRADPEKKQQLRNDASEDYVTEKLLNETPFIY